MITAVDTNVLVDILEADRKFGPSSRHALRECLHNGSVVACEVVWAEVATAYAEEMAGVTQDLRNIGVVFSPMSEQAALKAAECWAAHRQGGGTRDRIVADFLIGAHALVQCDRLLTRDREFYRGYFKSLQVYPGQIESS